MRIFLLFLLCLLSSPLHAMRRVVQKIPKLVRHEPRCVPRYAPVHYRHDEHLNGIAWVVSEWDEKQGLWVMIYNGIRYASPRLDDVFYPYDEHYEESSFVKEELLPLSALMAGLCVAVVYEAQSKQKD